jgi:hypothetical protein
LTVRAVSIRPPGSSSSEPPDPYSDLLSETRGLKREQRILRENWLNALVLEGKDELLFEFEVLLKASACFANPRNHPGPPRRSTVVAQDFRPALVLFHEGLERAVSLARSLLGQQDRAFVFQRYLETVLPEDSARTKMAGFGTGQLGPEESLSTLRHGLTTLDEVISGVIRAQRVPYRSFYANLALAQREVSSSVFFNPLTALEFRPEFDRIKSPAVLDLIRAVPGEESRRLIALTFLALFRMLRYLRLLSRIQSDAGNRRRQGQGRAYLVLSVLRSDGRALSDYLRQHAGQLLGQSFHRDVIKVRSSQIRDRSPELRAGAYRLIGIKSALDGIAGNLRLELRRAFQHDLPAPDQNLGQAEFRAAIGTTLSNLRPALQNAILFLGKALGSSLEDGGGVFDDQAARRESSDRLRRDVWMFAQIVRAFSIKAQHSSAEDRWAPVHGFAYVREFLSYFRAMGYPLLRSTDYPRFDAFLGALSNLEDTDLVDPSRLERAIDECMAFHGFLEELFQSISRREELNGLVFDRRAAASTLKLYLGD